VFFVGTSSALPAPTVQHLGCLSVETAVPVRFPYTSYVTEEQRKPMTHAVCLHFCQQFPLAKFHVLQNGNECMCAPFVYDVPGSGCDKPCEGDDKETCGGVHSASVVAILDCDRPANCPNKITKFDFTDYSGVCFEGLGTDTKHAYLRYKNVVTHQGSFVDMIVVSLNENWEPEEDKVNVVNGIGFYLNFAVKGRFTGKFFFVMSGTDIKVTLPGVTFDVRDIGVDGAAEYFYAANYTRFRAGGSLAHEPVTYQSKEMEKFSSAVQQEVLNPSTRRLTPEQEAHSVSIDFENQDSYMFSYEVKTTEARHLFIGAYTNTTSYYCPSEKKAEQGEVHILPV